MSAAILLIAHGSRRAAANADLVAVAQALAPRVEAPIVEIAYLELAEPSIPQGLQRCLSRGATEIRMLPYFLSAGSHVSDDLRTFRAEFIQAQPEIAVTICPPLGLHPLMIEILIDRLKEQLHE
ncbi:sirohydrochlorin chelatase [Planctomicrobium sp. SH664]|uniref:sirohydrochlorin chelatase n=1 Tax=Planctomicrobium sp. SH664 TaxID=3448125 RepID=UPI003F5C5638